MYKKTEPVAAIHSANCTKKSFNCAGRVLSLLIAGLLALLLQSPIYATDPIDVDPDPDAPVTIVVQSLEEVDTDSLPPGDYVIIVVAEDGSRETYEIRKL